MLPIEKRPVKGFESTHFVYSDGRVEKLSISKHQEKYIVLKPHRTRENSRKTITLQAREGDGYRRRVTTVAQLVAEAFIPNPHNYKYVICKDGNSENNQADNLAWSESPDVSGKAIINVTLGVRYASILEAVQSTGLSYDTITRACDFGLSANGYSFVYADMQKPIIPLQRSGFMIESLPSEWWRDLPDTLGQYQISNKGRIKSTLINLNNMLKKERLIKPKSVGGNAYIHVRVHVRQADGTMKDKRKYITLIQEIPRVFPEYFPEQYRSIVFKDGNVCNLALDNLEALV